MKNVIKTPYFWTIFVATSFLAAGIAYHYFPQALPIIHLNLTMNRSQAVEHAQQITTLLKLGPQESSHAASFVTDNTVKTFIELEAGGKEAFISMMEQNLYQPYTWNVRQFKPFEQNEVVVRFTPDGIPYGFQEKISENETGNNVTESKAQAIAKPFASSGPWNINFDEYKLVEASQETKASGRVDHTIMYERKDVTIGEGFYRLKLVISGDKVSELSHWVKVPDAFTRRYQQMRSANETIAYAANLIMILLYVLGCVLFGLFFLFKKRYVIWRTPLYWALFIAALASLNIANKLPLYWMMYNTALSPYGFLIQFGIIMLSSFIIQALLFALVFMGAESLTRRAFGNQMQLWHLFRPSVASSYTMLGYTISGYLLVPIVLAYTTLFYLFTMRFFNWWTPSSALFDPNVLASYFPWFESISVSLQAGFYEECLFRAVPLATAALLGTRFGKRSWWIAGAFILQAIVFGAAHANYPAQPAYARLVELIGISSLFGGVYLRFGLLISIIAHFIYDVFWFALPIFISSAPYAWISKSVVVLLASIPLLIVFISRLKEGAWLSIPTSLYNKAWQPPEKVVSSAPPPAPQKTHTLSPRTMYTCAIAGIAGLIAWGATTQFQADSPTFSTTRSQTTTDAVQTLQNKQVDMNKWYPIVYPLSQLEQLDLTKQHCFVWQEGGKNIYHNLLGNYLMPQLWIARFVTWQGDVTQRAEEHHFYFLPDGLLKRYTHKVPESEPGASLAKEAAQTKALEAVAQQFNRTPEQLNEVSSIANKQPERLDWVITYSSKTDYPLDKGEARIAVSIAGDEVIDTNQYVHVPEQWERNHENKQFISNIISQLCILLVYILLLVCIGFATTRWRIQITRAFLFNLLVLSAILLFELINYWPTLVATFNTSQPFTDQLFRMFSMSSVMVVLRAAMLAFMISFVTQIRSIYRTFPSWFSIPVGIGLGSLAAGSLAILKSAIPSLCPTWASYIPLGFVFPISNGIDSALLTYLSTTINISLLVIVCDAITNYWQRLKPLGIGMFLLAGFVGAGLINTYNMPLWIASGIVLAILFLLGYLFAIRFDRSIIPIATGSYMILSLLQQAIFNAYPYAFVTNIGAIIIVAGVAWYWHKQLQN